jgi:hypothetical protein
MIGFGIKSEPLTVGQNSANELLYVGITGEPVRRRLQGHRRRSSWFKEIVRIDIDHFPTRTLAEIAEQIANLIERPKYNVRRDSNLARQHCDGDYVCAKDYRHLLRSKEAAIMRPHRYRLRSSVVHPAHHCTARRQDPSVFPPEAG